MTYYVYENWVAEKKARIHKGSCSHCKEGNGTGRNTLGKKNGQWHGPFSSYNEAKKLAESLEDRVVSDCGHCKPNID